MQENMEKIKSKQRAKNVMRKETRRREACAPGGKSRW